MITPIHITVLIYNGVKMHVQNSHYGSGIRRILSPVVSVFWKEEEFDVSLLFHALKQTKNNTHKPNKTTKNRHDQTTTSFLVFGQIRVEGDILLDSEDWFLEFGILTYTLVVEELRILKISM